VVRGPRLERLPDSGRLETRGPPHSFFTQNTTDLAYVASRVDFSLREEKLLESADLRKLTKTEIDEPPNSFSLKTEAHVNTTLDNEDEDRAESIAICNDLIQICSGGIARAESFSRNWPEKPPLDCEWFKVTLFLTKRILAHTQAGEEIPAKLQERFDAG